MKKVTHLHIVSFDNPYPPNYGGVIDVYYKIKALSQLGVKVILHAFEYGRKPAPQLEEVCYKVFYYQRRTFVNPFIGSLPYIVNTRNSEELLQHLLADEHPILFEGLHTCFFLDDPTLKNRMKIVRMHNIEHDYYARLEDVEKNFFKKYFFAKESQRLREFEQVLHFADLVFAISPGDEQYLSGSYQNVHYVPAFHPNEQVTGRTGKGDFALYHGKLSVGENDEGARFLVGEVFPAADYPLRIAGDRPSTLLKKGIAENANVSLLDHLDTAQISEQIAQAHINVLPTFQSTGIKLKLINVLYQGRHVLVNKPMIVNTGLEELCHVATTPQEFRDRLVELKDQPFTEEEKEKRSRLLEDCFSNRKNAEKMLALIGC